MVLVALFIHFQVLLPHSSSKQGEGKKADCIAQPGKMHPVIELLNCFCKFVFNDLHRNKSLRRQGM